MRGTSVTGAGGNNSHPYVVDPYRVKINPINDDASICDESDDQFQVRIDERFIELWNMNFTR